MTKYIEFSNSDKRRIRSGIEPEGTLIVACAGIRTTPKQIENIRACVRECKDWDGLMEMAQRHHVMPLLSSNLDKRARDLVPAETIQMLNDHLRENTLHNLFLTQELLSLIRHFRDNGIQAIPFKGPTLATAAYGSVALRKFVDLDILVSKADLARAGEMLKQRGYNQLDGQASSYGSDHVESQLGCDYIRTDGKVHIEMHWSFLQKWLGFNLDLAVLWKNLPSVEIAGTQVLTLPTETLLMYLCAHGCKHRWNRLCWVVDVAEVIRAQPTLAWPDLLKNSKKIGSLRTLLLGLHLADILLDAKIPPAVLKEIESDATVATLAREICAKYFVAESADAVNGSDLSNDWFYLRTKERWKERRSYLSYLMKWLLLPSQTDREWVRLPFILGWLYIFLRPVRVLCGFFINSEKTRDFATREQQNSRKNMPAIF